MCSNFLCNAKKYEILQNAECLVTEINQWLPAKGTVGWITDGYTVVEGDRHVHY